MKHVYASTHLTNELSHPDSESPNPSNAHLNITQTRPCILVVEDDPSVAELLKIVLGDFGYHTLVAQNGREGLNVVANHAVDGIMLDMHMPVMDGRTMLDELRWLGYQMPVLIMSGGLDLPALRQLLSEGAQGFLLKPVTLQSLKQSCQQIFENGEPSNGFFQPVHLASSQLGKARRCKPQTSVDNS